MATATRSRTQAKEDFPEAPAPWSTRCETYWMVTQLPSPLPVDIWDPLEATHSTCTVRDFKMGSTGVVMIVRYFDTPVGEYDELAIIPGTFSVTGGPEKGQNRSRITRIYVNQKETTFNARFEFSSPRTAKGSSPPNELTVTVYPPEGYKVRAEIPFFKATFTTMSWTPSFPLSTKYFVNTKFVQPPIPAGEDTALFGTDSWKSYDVSAWSNRAKLVWVKTEEGRNIVPKGWFPKFKPWSFGFMLQDATLDISKPEEWQ
ncbi:hypothetical protein LTR86_002550 [Recurvomyces mirabilis]|nr:hypothetical protein LTR86_002550 [Recurvomyces mirabilis]